MYTRYSVIALLHDAQFRGNLPLLLYKFSSKHTPIKTRPEPHAPQAVNYQNSLRNL